MKLSALISLVVLSVMPVGAQKNGVSVSTGDFRFDTSGASGAIQYDARLEGAAAQGQITFIGVAEIAADEVDEIGGSGETTSTTISVVVTVDCVKFSQNRAAMSGIITTSNLPAYQGIRALLAVEDNGEGSRPGSGDKFTWGFYRPASMTWVPSDADVEGDTGASLNWIATDFEREDDIGIPGRPSTVVDCKSFPLSAYGFIDVAQGAGNIQVRP